MLTDIQFLQAFEAAIPGFKATEPEDPMPRDDPEDTVHWIERMLGESFCCQVRWKDLFGELDGLNDLHPIQRAGIQLSRMATRSMTTKTKNLSPTSTSCRCSIANWHPRGCA